MATRQEVYSAIDSERDYQDVMFQFKVMTDKTIGDWVTLIRVYLRRAEDIWMYDHPRDVVESPLDVVRKIAGLGVWTMELLGAVRRTEGKLSSILVGPLDRNVVYQILDQERDYQDSIWGTLDERNSVGDFLTYMKELSRKADALSNADAPELALDQIRKITGVAVACMERHGAFMRMNIVHQHETEPS